ncbi:MAG: phenylalanine--tRNA ligase subunit beta [Candidatus Ancillula trichonymphae]|jgi:phenylalanyl-tRNA synthetase beta chain|nr:phenylalanine--tRNA ligase subunit beta [Candidatus Ancillula trichonymphae]
MINVNIDWLSDFTQIPQDLTAEQLALDLAKVGLEEGVIHKGKISGSIVLGRVLTIEPEEQKNGKVINYCRVDVGKSNDSEDDETKELMVGSRGIICGAHNFKVGDLVVVALPGAVLPGDFEISPRRTYGHISNGMICSEKELGLDDTHTGILVLNDSGGFEIGDDVKELLGLGGEILEINVTPDRGYCFSYRGIAREYAISTGAAFKDLALEVAKESSRLSKTQDLEVILDDKSPIHQRPGCSKFVVMKVEGIDSAVQTPQWMVNRLESVSIRSVSLPVDVTNFVMMHFGTPLHAYDLDTLTMPVIVRRARADETLATLDGKVHNLHPEDLLICDSSGGTGAQAVGIAGVMGGQKTEVTQNTKNILLEGAYFDPVSVSRSARRHKIPSESSKRFERGIDSNLQLASVYFAAKLLSKYGHAKLSESYCEVGDGLPNWTIDFSCAEVYRLLGVEIETEQVVKILEEIGCSVKKTDKDAQFAVQTPSWRPDLRTQADLVEEIARIYGYDKIPSVLPVVARAGRKPLAKVERSINMRKLVSTVLAARGFTEVLSYPFISRSNLHDEPSAYVELANPLAGDRPFLRTILLETLLETASLNVRRGKKNLQIFEIGSVYHPPKVPHAKVPQFEGGKPLSKAELGQIARAMPMQPKKIAGVVVNSGARKEWFSGQAPAPDKEMNWVRALETAKSVVALSGACQSGSLVVEQIQLENFRLLAIAEFLHPGRCAKLLLVGKEVGIVGELDEFVCNKYDLPPRASAFEIDLDALLRLQSPEPLKAVPVSTYPEALEDFAFVVSKNLHSATVVSAVRSAIERTSKELGICIISHVKVFDVFTHEKLGVDKKSLSISVTLQAESFTLQPEEIRAFRQKIIESAEEVGGELRS